MPISGQFVRLSFPLCTPPIHVANGNECALRYEYNTIKVQSHTDSGVCECNKCNRLPFFRERSAMV